MVAHIGLRTNELLYEEYYCQNFISLRESRMLQRGSKPYSTYIKVNSKLKTFWFYDMVFLVDHLDWEVAFL